ncbi:MAG: hypothetical protein CM15mP109_05800 [Candidatus Dadabacteria bacterium]|nr:MAG: hypothetical protein CM15mP109_05800 [Candidatus Dadabacteria bacterium]
MVLVHSGVIAEYLDDHGEWRNPDTTINWGCAVRKIWLEHMSLTVVLCRNEDSDIPQYH